MIEYSIPERGSVRIEIYSSLGELVKVLVDEVKEAGYYSVSLDASQLPSGTYIYQMIAKGSEKSFVQSKKMSLIK
jgi:flagellar hook assembly protein FlgD